ncbi:MAG: hypothetical protein U9Q27_01660 [Patescibacteria group bacterium]|nr:hypothetical protein [Patescibacteria group bacterium]
MKKIIDIVPPNKKSFNRFNVNSIINIKQGFKKKLERSAEIPKSSGFATKNKRKFNPVKSVFVGILLIGLFSYCYFALGSAKIEIWPKTRVLEFKETISIDGDIDNFIFSKNIITGKNLEIKKEISEKFFASGSASEKAKGVIRIYNNYSTKSQILVATTRFVSASGKLFRIAERVKVPGKRYEQGKLVPGYIDAIAIADQAGEDYNIDATTFSIPGFAGSSKYTMFYAKSFSEMSGGGEFARATQKDLDNAESVVLQKALEQGEKEIKKEAKKGNFILLDHAIFEETIDSFASEISNTKDKEFVYKVEKRFKAIAFSEQELKKFAENFLLAKIAKDKQLYLPSLEINYSFDSANFEENKITIILEIMGKEYSGFDIQYFKKALAEKTLTETQIILASDEEIERFEIDLSPFWIKKIPENFEKININLIFD